MERSVSVTCAILNDASRYANTQYVAYFDPNSESRDERAARLKASQGVVSEEAKTRETPIVETPA